ncbi:MAG TPA: hypothetical protein VN851_27365 [Thermoanaerobaculia bacterium]|nr:hypothetical protein [Thermoanaerobaculia bacterium]
MTKKTIPLAQRRGLLEKKIIPLAQRKGLFKEKTTPRILRNGLFLPEFDFLVRQIVGRRPKRVVGNGKSGDGVKGFGRRIRKTA